MPSKAFRAKTGSLLDVLFFSSSSLGCHVFAGKIGILAFRRFRIPWNRRPNNSRLHLRLDQVKAHICGCLFCHEIFLFVSDGLEVHPLAFFPFEDYDNTLTTTCLVMQNIRVGSYNFPSLFPFPVKKPTNQAHKITE